MNTQNQPDETNSKQPAPEEKFTPELLIPLAKLALDLCDVVVMCAPPFADGSHGARVVAVAHNVRPRLVGMLAAKTSQSAPADAPSDHAQSTQGDQPT